MCKLNISITLKQARRQKQAIDSEEAKGVFLWVGSVGVVDWVIGYHKTRGFIADKAYNTGNHWIRDIFKALFDAQSFIRLTRFI